MKYLVTIECFFRGKKNTVVDADNDQEAIDLAVSQLTPEKMQGMRANTSVFRVDYAAKEIPGACNCRCASAFYEPKTEADRTVPDDDPVLVRSNRELEDAYEFAQAILRRAAPNSPSRFAAQSVLNLLEWIGQEDKKLSIAGIIKEGHQ